MLRTCNESVNLCKGGIFCVFLAPCLRYLCRHCEVPYIETTIPPYMDSTVIRPRYDRMVESRSKGRSRRLSPHPPPWTPLNAALTGFRTSPGRLPRHARTGLRSPSDAVSRRVTVSLSENIRERPFFDSPECFSETTCEPYSHKGSRFKLLRLGLNQ